MKPNAPVTMAPMTLARATITAVLAESKLISTVSGAPPINQRTMLAPVSSQGGRGPVGGRIRCPARAAPVPDQHRQGQLDTQRRAYGRCDDQEDAEHDLVANGRLGEGDRVVAVHPEAQEGEGEDRADHVGAQEVERQDRLRGARQPPGVVHGPRPS